MKNKNEIPLVFGGITNTINTPKYSNDKDGNINSDFNNKLFLKKAYKAYKKGKVFFKYKGSDYIVPRVPLNEAVSNEDFNNLFKTEEE